MVEMGSQYIERVVQALQDEGDQLMTDKREVELRELAEKATLGPWKACGSDRGGCVCGQVWSTAIDHPVASTNVDSPEEGISTTKEVKVRDAAYIAAASPDYILQLLTKISQLEQQLEISKSAYNTNLQTLQWNHQQDCNEWDNERFRLEQQILEIQGNAAIRFAEAEARWHRAEEGKNTAYSERDRLVCAISKVFPSWMERHPLSDTTWEDDWRWIVFVQFPTGQASWHIHDSEESWFDHLERRDGNSWDGHSTAEKYARIERFDLIGSLPVSTPDAAEGGK